MGFNLPADGGTVFANVPGNLGHFEPLLKSGLDRQSVVIGKVLLAHRYLQSEGRTETTIPEDDIKRNHEVTGATPWLLSHTILSATDDVAFRFSINPSDSQENTGELSTDTSLTVADGDTVNIDYVGTVDGVEFDGGSTNGTGTDLVIGSGSYIDDFEDQLIGAHPGDEVQVEVTFPDDYGSQDLAGKDAVFAVTVNGIYQ